jgi:hypothetical protein
MKKNKNREGFEEEIARLNCLEKRLLVLESKCLKSELLVDEQLKKIKEVSFNTKKMTSFKDETDLLELEEIYVYA